MKVLYVVGACLTRNTSANMSHNAYIQGMIENNCDIDIIMEDESWGNEDETLKKYQECHYFEYKSLSLLEKVRNKFSYVKNQEKQAEITKKVDEFSSSEDNKKISIKAKIRNAVKNLYYSIFVSDSVYSLNKTWLRKASKFKSDKIYDLVVSNSSPAASHKLVDILLNKKNIKCKRWIQIWEDPWYYDIYGGLSEEVKIEEHNLLKSAQEVFYVSPLTLMYQKKYFSDCAEKMKCIPLPYLEYTDNSKKKTISEVSFGYFGDYYSKTRNLKPFYEALVASNSTGFIYGDSDENFAATEKIDLSGRVTLDKLSIIQDKTSVLVNLCNLKAGQIPGKIYHYSATNKPILFILDGTEDEVKAILNYFSQFNRYYFCRNNVKDICSSIELIKEEINFKEYKPVEQFNPKNVAELFLGS